MIEIWAETLDDDDDDGGGDGGDGGNDDGADDYYYYSPDKDDGDESCDWQWCHDFRDGNVALVTHSHASKLVD